jgi:cyanophycinase-like exopeptidase
MSGTLVIMGSGETTPTMVTTHRRVLADLGPEPSTLLLDTPYGFQANADEITEKARRYFAASVGVEVGVGSLRRTEDLGAVGMESLLAEVAEADWVFSGPGSPTYLVRQWSSTRLPEVLARRLGGAGATVFASAAAVTLGAFAVPVYEIYKAGADPHWVEGLDLLRTVGIDAICVPHFDNNDGGTHDTRYCYLGEHRLAALEEQLPSTTWVLGVDEHTALVIDLGSGRVRVEGRGAVTVRSRDTAACFPAATEVGLEDLLAAARGTATAMSAGVSDEPSRRPREPEQEAAPATPLQELVAESSTAFDTAMARGSALEAAEVAVSLESDIRDWATDVADLDHLDRARVELRRQVTALARAAEAGMHDHRDLVAPHVEVLLRLRDRAREERRYSDADAIRDALASGGVEVRDTAEGSTWDYEEPTAPHRD